MTERVASILAEIGLDASKFTSGANTIGGLTSKLIDGIAGLNPVIGVAIGAFTALFTKAKEWEAAANESAKAGAKVDAVLQSTKHAAGITKDELDELAQTVSKSAGVDDELVQSAEAVLLTFTKVNKDVFPETITIAQDMAAVLGGDLNSTIVQVGKAMNDFSGYTALKRAGVSFSEEQIEQIQHFKDTNDIIGYQNLLLKELQTEFGGAAEKINEVSDGSDNLKISQENVSEALGREFMPVAKAWNEFWTNYNEHIAESINSSLDYEDTVKSLGITTVRTLNEAGLVVDKYYKGNIELSYSEVKSLYNTARGWDAYGDSLQAWADSYKELHQEAVKSEEDLEALSEKYQNILSLTSSLQSETDEYTNSMDDLHKKQADAKADLDKAMSSGWDTKGVEDAQKAYDDITQQISDLEEEHKKATNTIVYNNLLQKLSVDGLTDSEFAMAQQTGVALGLFTQATADSGVAINDLTTLLANGQITQEEFNLVVNSGTDAIHAFIDSINAIPEHKTTTITTIYTSAGGDVTYSAGGSGLVHAYQARATGGLADGTTLVGENGPELVDLPGGSMVYNANTTNQLLNNNDSVTYEQMRTLFNQQTQLLPILLANAIEKVVR